MKRIFLLLISILLIPFLLPIPLSHAETVDGQELFTIADARNRNLVGEFYDRTLEEKLGSDGRLGQLLISAQARPLSNRILFIDPMLIEEVQDLTDGFTLVGGESVEASEIATVWLNRLQRIINGDEVAATIYGNPEPSFLSRSAPTELRIQKRLSTQRLSELLSREVSEIDGATQGMGTLPTFITEKFTAHRKEIRNLNRYAKNPVTRSLRLTNASLLNPLIPKERSFALTKELSKELERYANSVRITKGRFTLTSKRERLPLTLINDLTNDLTIRFVISSSNSRIVVEQIEPITIAAESKIPFTVPIEVLSSGESEVIIKLKTARGISLGDEVRLPINLAVISPITTWITTGSGLILLFAAIIQSIRRVKRSREKKSSDDV